MAFDQRDETFMRRALALAEKGRGRAEPNPLVGAVVVRDARIVGEGFHDRFGAAHAEVGALSAAGDQARGGTLYVTLEPCDHAGKTPACAPMVARAGLRRLVVAALDPTAARPRGGVRAVEAAGACVQVGLCRRDAARLNAGFFKLASQGRPLVTAKWAMSLDGRIATRTGSSRWISSPEARRVVHRLRGVVDCVMVGVGTALADDPLLTCRQSEPRRTAARLVLCGRRAPRPDSHLALTAREAPVLLAHAARRPPEGLRELLEAGCEALALPAEPDAPDRVSPGALLDALGARRMTNVLLEGGADVLGRFFDAGLVDRVMAFIAPRLLGGAAAKGPLGAQGVATVAESAGVAGCRVRRVGPDLLLDGWLHEPVQWVP